MSRRNPNLRYDRFSTDYLQRVLARASAENRTEIAAHVKDKKAAGLKPGTLAGTTLALVDLSLRLEHAPIRQATPEQLKAALESYASSHAPYSTQIWAGNVKCYYKWVDGEECPKAVKKALKWHQSRGRAEPALNFPVIAPEAFDAMLQAVAERADRRDAVRAQALLWTFWDSGLRLSELLALRVGSVRFDAKGGATLDLPSDAPGLKTGPRSVYVVESAGALRAWIALHPTPDDPSAPLFATLRAPVRAMNACTVRHVLASAARQAGVHDVHPHRFRHTRATRAAEAGWNEAQLRRYFGWANNSEMAAYYVHLSRTNVEERVRQDAQIDPLGAMIRKDPRAAMAEAVKTAATESASTMAREILHGLGFSKARDSDDSASSPAATVP